MRIEKTPAKNIVMQLLLCRKGNTRKDAQEILARKEKFKLQLQTLFSNFSAVLFTGTLFAGGSYFFFIQLAEYGW